MFDKAFQKSEAVVEFGQSIAELDGWMERGGGMRLKTVIAIQARECSVGPSVQAQVCLGT